MNLDKNNILHLANLAKLELSDEEAMTFSRDLSDILAYVAKINQLDLKNIKESLTGIDTRYAMPPRPDTVETSAFKMNNNFVVTPHVFKNAKK